MWRRAWPLGVLWLTLALVGPARVAAQAGSPSSASLLDFVTFDRIDYIRFADEPGRPLTRDDLGIEFATVGCSIGEDNRNCSYGLDGAAAFLPAGHPLTAGFLDASAVGSPRHTSTLRTLPAMSKSAPPTRARGLRQA